MRDGVLLAEIVKQRLEGKQDIRVVIAPAPPPALRAGVAPASLTPDAVAAIRAAGRAGAAAAPRAAAAESRPARGAARRRHAGRRVPARRERGHHDRPRWRDGGVSAGFDAFGSTRRDFARASRAGAARSRQPARRVSQDPRRTRGHAHARQHRQGGPAMAGHSGSRESRLDRALRRRRARRSAVIASPKATTLVLGRTAPATMLSARGRDAVASPCLVLAGRRPTAAARSRQPQWHVRQGRSALDARGRRPDLARATNCCVVQVGDGQRRGPAIVQGKAAPAGNGRTTTDRAAQSPAAPRPNLVSRR